MKISRLFLGAALLLTSISANAQYPRKIVVEQFTSEYVSDCFTINSVADPLLASKGPQILPIKVHLNVNNSKLAGDQLTNYGRPFFYYGSGSFNYGAFIVNGGIVPFSTSLQEYIQNLESSIRNFENQTSPIKLTVLEDRTTDKDNIEVSVVLETDVTETGTKYVFMNFNEDNIPNSLVGGNNGETMHRWTSRKYYPTTTQATVFELKKGMKGFYFTVSKNDPINYANIRSIAWVQDGLTKEILQAEVTSKPPKEDAMIFADSNSLFFDKSSAKVTKDIGLQNRGYGYMNLNKIELVGPNADKFVLSYTASTTRLHPAERMSIRVRLKNPEKGTFSAKLAITTNAVNTPVFEIPINSFIDGDLLYPEIKSSQNKIEFGDVTTFIDKTISFSNSGNATLEVARASLLSQEDTLNFKILSGPFPDRLEAGQRFDMKIRFIPTTDESYYSNFSVYSNAQTNPTLSIDMTGAGKNVVPFSDFEVLNDSLKFGTLKTQQVKTININNIGTDVLKITDCEILNDTKSQFKVVSSKNATIPQFGNYQLEVSFQPKETGFFNAQLLMTSNATKPNNIKRFYLSGAGDIASVREEAISNELGISLSPSPTDNFLNISLKEPAKADFIRIYSSTGALIKELKDFMISNNQNGISVSDLSSGAYVVLVSANGKLSQEKFTVKR